MFAKHAPPAHTQTQHSPNAVATTAPVGDDGTCSCTTCCATCTVHVSTMMAAQLSRPALVLPAALGS